MLPSTNSNRAAFSAVPLMLLIASFSGAASAASYEITAGMGYTVCEAFKHHLDERTEENPMVCRAELDPRLDGFSRPDWHELSLDKPENLALFRKLDQIARDGVRSDVNGGKLVEELTKEEWLKDFRHHKRGPGEPHLYKGKLGLDGEGADETVVAVTWGSKACQRYVANMQGDNGLVDLTGPYNVFIYNEKKDRINLKITDGSPIGFSGDDDVLVFQGRAFFFDTYYLPPGYSGETPINGESAVHISTYEVFVGNGGLLTRCIYEMDLGPPLKHSIENQ